MLQRTLVLVDTSYLLASFYNSWDEGARGQLEISLATVVHRIDQVAHGLVDQPVQRQNWYDGIPDSGPHRYQRTLRVIEGVQLRAGQLIEWGDRRTQKAVDTLLVADMIQAAYRGHCSDMVLVTGDADMIPGVRVAVDAGSGCTWWASGGTPFPLRSATRVTPPRCSSRAPISMTRCRSACSRGRSRPRCGRPRRARRIPGTRARTRGR